MYYSVIHLRLGDGDRRSRRQKDKSMGDEGKMKMVNQELSRGGKRMEGRFGSGLRMLLAMLFCRYLLKDNIGHGVTKALQAVSRHESRIKPHNMWSSVVASSVTIGFGGSVGAEAPIVYTGAAIGSNFARMMGMSYRNMTILLGCLPERLEPV